MATSPNWDAAPFEQLPAAGSMYGRGAGPVFWEPKWRLRAFPELDGWTIPQVEVWASDGDAGMALRPISDGVRVTTAPLVVRGRYASASLNVTLLPDRTA
ncbi:MAG: hypothetical protein ABI622_01115 [Chloroflexota bacterium]